VNIPEDDPAVLVDFNNPENGTLSQLSIYEDVTVIYVEDSGLEVPAVQGDEYTRTWRTGKVSSGDIDYFFDYIDSVGFNEIEYAYLSPDIKKRLEMDLGRPSLGIGESEDYIRIYANNNVVDNTIYAIGFFISWAAGEKIKDRTSSHLQRVSAEGELLWGEDGIKLGP